MSKTVITSILTAGMVMIFTAGMSFAKSDSISLLYQGKFDHQLMLKPGHYKVVVNNTGKTPEAAFYKGRKLMGQVPVKLVPEPQKSQQTAVYYNAAHNNVREVTEITLNGWHQKLVFPSSASATKSD